MTLPVRETGPRMNFRSAIFCRAFLQWAALPNFHNILAIPSLTLSLPQSQSPFTTGSVQINQLSGRAHTQLDYDSSWCNSTYGWHGIGPLRKTRTRLSESTLPQIIQTVRRPALFATSICTLGNLPRIHWTWLLTSKTLLAINRPVIHLLCIGYE